MKDLFKKSEEDLFKEIDASLTRHLFIHEEEEFKNINFEEITNDKYEISNYGRVYSKESEKFLKQYTISETNSNKQYKQVHLYNNSIGYSKRVHRIVAHHFCETPREDQTMVNHKDSNGLNNHYSNLEWCNHQENMDHMVRIGNSCAGEKNSKAKLTNEQVHQICKMLEQDCYTYNEILEYLGLEVSFNMNNIIGQIKRGLIWKNISSQYNMPDKVDNKPRQEEEIHQICKMMSEGYSSKEIAMTIYGIDNSDKKELSKKYKFFTKLKSRTRYKDIVDQYDVPYPNKK